MKKDWQIGLVKYQKSTTVLILHLKLVNQEEPELIGVLSERELNQKD